jgi:diguanylate cyclase (GGDEF)-like protein/PAS domain S-box-containing protein
MLARLAADNEMDRVSGLTQATRIVGSAIGSDDVRLFMGDGVHFEAYPKRENEDFFGLSPEGSVARNTEVRRLGGPVVYHVAQDRWPRDFAPADGQAGGAYLALALWYGDASAGSVVANGPWKPAAARPAGQFLEAAGPALAIMLERVVDAERGERIREQMNALSSVARVFTDAKSMESVLQDMANAINSAAGFLTSVDVLDAHGRITMRSAGASRYTGTPLYESWVKMIQAPDHVKTLILKDRQPVLLPDLQRDPRISEEARDFYVRASIVSGATFPLLLRDKIVGLLRVGSLQPTAFPPPMVALLQELAVQAAMVVNAVQLQEEQERAKNALGASEERFRSLVQNAADLITVIEVDTTIIYQSPSIQQVLGYAAGEVLGKKLSDFVHPDDIGQIVAFLREAMDEPSGAASIVARLRHQDESWRYVEIVGTDRRHVTSVHGFVLNIRDVTERRELEEQLRYQAFHDPLTGLANRARFMDRLEHELGRSTRHGRTVGMLFMDLDDFKSVNDALGHPAGDRLLLGVAARLQLCLRPGDTAARFGGDEFAVLLEEIDRAEDAVAVGERIIEALQEPIALDEKEVFTRASIGVALGQRGQPRAEELLRRADVAMYVAKGRGKGRCEVYEPGMQESMVERLTLAADLQRAVERGEFVVHYQPEIELSTGRIVGVEALVRWQHPERGLLPPEEFIGLAEETGLILLIGRWVLREACQQARRWQQLYAAEPPLALAVNVSVKQIRQGGLAKVVAEALRESGLPPESLILEITESVMMEGAEAAVERLQELKALGVRLAMDDFGMGYSSLSYLRGFPIDVLKIDKSFVDGMGTQENEGELAATIIELGRALHLKIVAEGIERPEQLGRLRTLHCNFGQGFYFARPVEGEAIDALLRSSGRTLRPPAAA